MDTIDSVEDMLDSLRAFSGNWVSADWFNILIMSCEGLLPLHYPTYSVLTKAPVNPEDTPNGVITSYAIPSFLFEKPIKNLLRPDSTKLDGKVFAAQDVKDALTHLGIYDGVPKETSELDDYKRMVELYNSGNIHERHADIKPGYTITCHVGFRYDRMSDDDYFELRELERKYGIRGKVPNQEEIAIPKAEDLIEEALEIAHLGGLGNSTDTHERIRRLMERVDLWKEANDESD